MNRRLTAFLFALLALVVTLDLAIAQPTQYLPQLGTTNPTWTVGGPKGIAYPGPASTAGQVLVASSPTVAAWTAAPTTGITQLTGAVTAGPGSGSQVATLSSTGVAVGSCGDSSHVGVIMYGADGRASSCTPTTIDAPLGSATGILSVGQIAPGTSGQIIGTVGGAAAWEAPPVSGITQLTGRGTAGPGSGSQVFALANSGITAATYGSASGSAVCAFSADGTASSCTTTPITASLPIATGLLSSTQVNPGSNGQVLTTVAGASAWATPISAGTLPGATYVCAPGGTAGPNVFTTWSALMAAVASNVGPITIVVTGTCHVTAGTWTFTQGVVNFVGGIAAYANVLLFDNGAQITEPTSRDTFYYVENVFLESQSSSPAFPILDGNPGFVQFSVYDNGFFGTSFFFTGTAPFVASGALGTTQIRLFIRNGRIGGAEPAFDLTTMLTPYAMPVVLLDRSLINSNAIRDPNNRVSVEVDSTSATYGTVPLANVTLATFADNLGYNDTLVSPTLGATQVQAAIDILKARFSSAGLALPANGGTGVASPTAHAVLVAEGSSPATPITMGDAKVLFGQTGADPAAKTISGDLACVDTGVCTVDGLGGVSVPTPPATGTTVLTDTTGALSWSAAAGGSGITQLTGAVTAGPGSGSQVATIAASGVTATSYGDASHIATFGVGADGRLTTAASAAVSIANANLTAGAYSNITGVGALASGSLTTGFTTINVAQGGSGVATHTAHGALVGEGTSAVATTAAGTAGQLFLGQGATSDPAFETSSQDVVYAASGVATVNSISAASAVSVSQPAFTWTSGAGAINLSQAAPASDLATTDLNLIPMPPFASATVHPVGGNANIKLATPSAGTAESAFQIERGGTIGISMGRYPHGPTFWQINFGANARSPSTTNFAFLGDDAGTLTELNATTEIKLRIGAAATDPLQLFSGDAEFFGTSGSSTLDGGVGVVTLTGATTIPTSAAASGHLQLYANSNALETNGSAIQFNKFVTAPIFTQATAAASTAGATMVLRGQTGGSGNMPGGNVFLEAGLPNGSGASSSISMESSAFESTVSATPAGALMSVSNGDGIAVQPGHVFADVGPITESLVHTGQSGFTTQQKQFDSFSNGGVIGMTGALVTATSQVALASGHSVVLVCHGTSYVTTGAGSMVAGDTAEMTTESLIKDVGGTVSRVGLPTTVSQILDTDYNASSTVVGWNNAGTTIGCFMAPVQNGGGAPQATVTVWGEAYFN